MRKTEEKMALEIIIGIVLIIAGILLTIAVLFQSDKNSRLSGTIAGGASETFFGKSKAKDADKTLNKLTIILTSVFVVIVLALYMFQVGTGKIKFDNSALDDPAAQTTTTTTTTTATTTTTTTTTQKSDEETPDTGDNDTDSGADENEAQ